MDYLKRFIGTSTILHSKKWGSLTFEVASFSPAIDGDLVIHIGNPFEQKEPLVRIHSVCVFSEVFGSDMCDCGEQLHIAMDRLTSEGHGLLFYLRFEARGVGLAAKVKATSLEVAGVDTYNSRLDIGVSPEARDFTPIGKYLFRHGVKRVRLLTNNPLKVDGLIKEGITVTKEPLIVSNPGEKVRQLLQTKARMFGHDLPEYK